MTGWKGIISVIFRPGLINRIFQGVGNTKIGEKRFVKLAPALFIIHKKCGSKGASRDDHLENISRSLCVAFCPCLWCNLGHEYKRYDSPKSLFHKPVLSLSGWFLIVAFFALMVDFLQANSNQTTMKN
ncbi:MAG: hypothetical protein OEL83_07055 [Desulforhopalus sp.]|nr:hypothetical protein [Desulforhopalus sp.]